MDMVFDPKNKPTEEFLIILKIQDGGLRSKVRNQPNLTPEITFPLGIWIRFVWFGQDLAYAYYLTLETSLWNNFSFFSKSKNATCGRRAYMNYTMTLKYGLFYYWEPPHYQNNSCTAWDTSPCVTRIPFLGLIDTMNYMFKINCIKHWMSTYNKEYL